ncbi:hypothetical protein ACIBCD_14405 [Nocardia brasiliensis]|uniref:hypothetical protein n=1 Tax=Nocardia brasiliensis TaxID=37326 RepID=UPI0037B9FEE0
MTGQPVERGDLPVELRWAAVQGCTLPTAAQPVREAEFAALFAAAVRTVQRPSPNLLRLAVAAGAEQKARDLAARVAVLDGLAAQAIEASGS